MPEGPEVESVRRSIETHIVGKYIENIFKSKEKLRTHVSEEDLRQLLGRKIISTHRKGKLLWLDCGENSGVFLRLGMSGRLSVAKHDEKVEKHTHFIIHFKNEKFELRLVDPRRFGDVKPFFTKQEFEKEVDKLGPDPFSWTYEEETQVLTKIRKSNRNIKETLMDQKLLSGVGNIYASEALFCAQISPKVIASKLSVLRLKRLLDCTTKVMKHSLEHGGTTFLSYLDANKQKGRFIDYLQVFQRDGLPCPRCKTAIKRITQGARATFYCPKCQRN